MNEHIERTLRAVPVSPYEVRHEIVHIIEFVVQASSCKSCEYFGIASDMKYLKAGLCYFFAHWVSFKC